MEFYAAQWGEAKPIRESIVIFMALKAGSTRKLMETNHFQTGGNSEALLVQMLQALAFLDEKGIIHRDVKPDNILYSYTTDGLHLYQLADFGVATRVGNLNSPPGTKKYKPPEVQPDLSMCHHRQTPKIDVWALFVSVAEAMNVDGFRFELSRASTSSDIIAAVQKASRLPILACIRDMATWDPRMRPSARTTLRAITGS